MISLSGGQAVNAGIPSLETASIAGTARVQGSVKFAGLVPKPNPINMVLHSPSFWALAILVFGVVFFLFRNA